MSDDHSEYTELDAVELHLLVGLRVRKLFFCCESFAVEQAACFEL